jgi:hypothetical protein
LLDMSSSASDLSRHRRALIAKKGPRHSLRLR